MAIKSQGLLLAVATAAAATKTITAATAANPVNITSAAHGYTQGQIIQIAGVAGMTQLNNGIFVVDTPITGSYNLKGVDGSAFTAYASGGTSSLQTMLPVSYVTNVSGFDGQASEIDTTHLQSTAKEFLLGLQDFGNVTLTLLQAAIGDASSTVADDKLRALKAAGAIGNFTITLADGSVAGFQALVKQFSFDAGGSDSKVSNSVTLRVTGSPSWFA